MIAVEGAEVVVYTLVGDVMVALRGNAEDEPHTERFGDLEKFM
jgi:hypothetical protein